MRVQQRSIHSARRSAPPSLKSGIHKFLMRGSLSLAAAALMRIPSWSQATLKDLGDKSIEDLMNIDVTSVSKKEQKTSQTAAAVFVISQEDIHRLGAANIPTFCAWPRALTWRRSTPAPGPSR